MEAMLNAEKPARKRFAWWFFGSALLMVMIALSYYYTTTNGTMTSPAKTRVAQTNNVSAGTPETTTGEAQNVSGNPISENNPVVSGTFIPSGEQYQMKTTETIPMAVSGKTHAFVEKQYETTVREENTTNSTTGILPATTNHHVNESATFVQEKQLMTGEPTGQIEEAVSSGNVAEMKEENPEITPSVEETTTRAVDVDELLLKKKTGFYVAADAGAVEADAGRQRVPLPGSREKVRLADEAGRWRRRRPGAPARRWRAGGVRAARHRGRRDLQRPRVDTGGDLPAQFAETLRDLMVQVQRVGDQEPKAQAHRRQSPTEQALPPGRSAAVAVVDVVFVQRFVVVVVAGHRGCDNGNSGESSAATEGAPGPLPPCSAGVATECRCRGPTCASCWNARAA